jgi:hypothetical protein
MKISYTGIVLDDASRDELLRQSGVTEADNMSGWKTVCHHMTICMGAAEAPAVQALVGQTVELEAIAFGALYLDDAQTVGIAAVWVQPQVEVPCKNAIPHVTLAHHPDVKAKQSNDITNWTKLDKPVQLRGVVEEVPFPSREKATA